MLEGLEPKIEDLRNESVVLVVDANIRFEMLARAGVKLGMTPDPVRRSAIHAKLPDADGEKHVAATVGVLTVEIERAEERVKTGIEERWMEKKSRWCSGLRACQRCRELQTGKRLVGAVPQLLDRLEGRTVLEAHVAKQSIRVVGRQALRAPERDRFEIELDGSTMEGFAPASARGMAHPAAVFRRRVDGPPIAAARGLKPRGVVVAEIQRASDFYIAEQQVLARPRLRALCGLLVSQRLQGHFQVARPGKHDGALNPVVSKVRSLGESNRVQPRRGWEIEQAAEECMPMRLRSHVRAGQGSLPVLLAMIRLGPVAAALPWIGGQLQHTPWPDDSIPRDRRPGDVQLGQRRRHRVEVRLTAPQRGDDGALDSSRVQAFLHGGAEHGMGTDLEEADVPVLDRLVHRRRKQDGLPHVPPPVIRVASGTR